MSSSISSGSEHTASVMSGEHKTDIGTTTVTVICNDPEGLDIYAVGSSNNRLGDTDLISNISSDFNISTGVYSSGNTNSSWSMKLTNMNDGLTSVSGKFGSYMSVPDTWDKVVYRDSSTGATAGASFQTTYDVYASSAQPSGVYTGQVRYIVVHPYNTAPPEMPQKTINDLVYMQDFATLSNADKISVLDSMVTDVQYQLTDSRDSKTYYISKLADRNVWMTQNLDHDIVSTPNYYTSFNTDLPANTTWTGTATKDTNGTSWVATIPESYNPGDLCWSGMLGDNMPINCNQNGSHYHLGNYYNWTAAVAMSDSGSFTTEADVNQSICPAGWRLPTKTGNKSIDNLATEASIDVMNYYANPVYFTCGGNISDSSNSLNMLSDLAVYQSSVVDDDSNSWGTYIASGKNRFDSWRSIQRKYGYSVRCVTR